MGGAVRWSVVLVVLLSCRAAPKATAIGEGGGSVELLGPSGGRAVLDVPAQAHPLSLTATAFKTDVVGVSDIYDFGPNGTLFDPPATLTITLGRGERMDFGQAYMATRETAHSEWTRMDGQRDFATKTIVVAVAHLSQFVIQSDSLAVSGRGTSFRANNIQVEFSEEVRASIVANPNLVVLGVAEGAADLQVRVQALEPHRQYFFTSIATPLRR